MYRDLDFVLIEEFYYFSIICVSFNYFMYLVCLFVTFINDLVWY